MAFSEISLSLNVGRIYRFHFIADFEALGHDPEVLGSGIYKVVQVLDKDEMYAVGKDQLVALYKKVAKSEADFNTDAPAFFTGKYYKLQPVEDVYTYYYVPEALILEHPEVTVSKYYKIMLALDLGVINDPNYADTLTDSINEIVMPLYGVQVVANPMTYREVYLGDDEFELIQADRNTRKEAVTNYKTETTRLLAENAILQNKIAALEAIVIAAQA